MKTITYNPETHVLVTIEPTTEMAEAGIRGIANAPDLDGIVTQFTPAAYESYSAMIAAAPQPESDESEPVYQFHPDGDNWIDCSKKFFDIWKDKSSKRVLYTHLQSDRTAELEATLKVAKDALDTCQWYSPGSCWILDPDKVEEAIDKINEVLKP